MEPAILAEPQRGHLIRANGLDIYYEEHGRGIPLLLIHGGTVNGACWRPYLAAFSARYRVIVPDSRGHGRTVNPLDTMSYRLLADDMVALAEELGLHRPLIIGYSDGGQVALEIGMRYPDLPQALVVGAAWFRFSETYRTLIRHIFGDEHLPDVDIERFARENPEWAEELQTLHGPDRWKGLLRQIKDLWSTPLNYISDDFARVVAPTLLLIGDRDEAIPVEEAVEMYRLLPNAELAVIPGANHASTFVANVGLTRSVILDFLSRHCPAIG